MAVYHSLGSVKCYFDVIVLSEVRSCNIDLYCNLLVGCNLHHDLALSSIIGGAGIYVKNTLD